MSNEHIDLSEFDDQYEQSEVPESDFGEDPPDGKYQVMVDKAEMAIASTGSKMLKWQFKILTGKYAGRMLFKNSAITPATLPYLKKELHVCGFFRKISELPEHVGELLDKQLEVFKKTKGKDAQGRDNVNVYINKQLAGVVPEGSANGTHDASSDIPF